MDSVVKKKRNIVLINPRYTEITDNFFIKIITMYHLAGMEKNIHTYMSCLQIKWRSVRLLFQIEKLLKVVE